MAELLFLETRQLQSLNSSLWKRGEVGAGHISMLMQLDADGCGYLAWGHREPWEAIKSHPRKAKYFHIEPNPLSKGSSKDRLWLAWPGGSYSQWLGVSRLSHVICLDTIMHMVWRLFAGVGRRQNYRYPSLFKSLHYTIFLTKDLH